MIWYLLNIVIITIAYLWPDKQELISAGYTLTDRKCKRLCVISTITWVLLSGLRHISIGADTATYKYVFDLVKRQSWSTLFNNFCDRYIGGQDIKDPGYPIFEKFFQIFSDSYQLFLVLIALIFFVSLGIFIYKFSKNPYLSYILFSTLFYGFFAITGSRQTIATALVVLLGTLLIKKRKFVPFLILVLLASTIHLSCLCFLPFYFISRIPINRLTMFVYWVAIVLSFVFRNQLLSLLQSIIGYEQYTENEGAQAGTFMYLLLAVAIVVTLFMNRLLKENPETMTISINALMVASFFSSLLLINQSCMRVVQYFALFLMILIPELASLFAKKSDKTVYNMLATFLLIVLFILNEPTYKFFWQ